MSDNVDNEHVKNQHSALTSLWPSDTEESKKLAEEKQTKRQNLTELGGHFKQAREALGYNISDLNEHTGLSFTELEALEQGQFQNIEQQDYVEYYVHTYASLIGLDADEALNIFKENFYETEVAVPQPPAEPDFDIHDEDQYEDAFADEAKKTIEALGASNLTALEPTDSFGTPAPDPQIQESPNFQALQTDHDLEPITSDAVTKTPFPWLKLAASFTVVLFAAYGAYWVNNMFNATPSNSSEIQENVASLNKVDINNQKVTDRVPDMQKAKKVGQLDEKVIKQGSTDFNAPTAEMVQKPLVLIGEQAKSAADQSQDELTTAVNNALDNAKSEADNAIKNIINDVIKPEEVEKIAETAAQAQPVADAASQANNDLAKATELAKAAQATQLAADQAKAAEAAAKAIPEPASAQLPEDPIQEALSQLPSDNSKFSLHATQNSWVLIEDDSSQILFSGELTPEKTITLPKVKGVIISLGDAGVINVYKGKELVGRLGNKDESLDLVSVEQRFAKISN